MLVKHFSFLCTGVQHARLTLGLPSRSTCVLADLACDSVVCGCGDPVHSGGELHYLQYRARRSRSGVPYIEIQLAGSPGRATMKKFIFLRRRVFYLKAGAVPHPLLVQCCS